MNLNENWSTIISQRHYVHTVIGELLDTCLLLFVCNCVAFLYRAGFAQALGSLPKFFLQTKLKEVGFSFLVVFVCLAFFIVVRIYTHCTNTVISKS